MRTALTRADRQAQTRDELVAAADRLFTRNGFHATSVDAVADAAGYTKGAVYSNFDSKEDLFFAVYERRVDRRVAEIEATPHGRRHRLRGPRAARSPRSSTGATRAGWRSSSSSGHMCCGIRSCAAASSSSTAALWSRRSRRSSSIAAERGVRLPEDPLKLATARLAVQTGLQLERLTQPELVDEGLSMRMMRLAMEEGGPMGYRISAFTTPCAACARRRSCRA